MKSKNLGLQTIYQLSKCQELRWGYGNWRMLEQNITQLEYNFSNSLKPPYYKLHDREYDPSDSQ